ncbi:hypothetical protein JL_212 [Bacillus phage JL]|uniref:Uncharacterized protein n=1 Tax=Bacillus phage JL TaxID=1296655 RepID=S5M4S0_9CAUD|nr:hypothetical protein AVV47_gp084 [Bacillus phage JL]AGR46876.1 hypothetical protein JL_212 [Bacillus phage JL]
MAKKSQDKLLSILMGNLGDAKLTKITSSKEDNYGSSDTIELTFEDNNGRERILSISSDHEVDEKDRDKIHTSLNVDVQYVQVEHILL